MPKPGNLSPRAKLRLKLACQLGEPRRAAEAVHGFLRQEGLSQTELMDCELALVEACNNAIKYASPEAEHKPLLVEASCDRNQVELRITDHTPGFDWPTHAALPDSESESGRGVYLIQSLMDSTCYVRGAGQNVLALRKKRHQSGVL